MRVAHFAGLHGLQILPLFGWLITRKRRQSLLNDDHRLALVWITGLAYISIVILLIWQALRGESVIHPDELIISIAGAAISIAAIAVGAVLQRALGERRARRRTGMELAAVNALRSGTER